MQRELKKLKIQVVGPGCKRCLMTESNVRSACTQLHLDATISHIYDMNEFPELGVTFTPAVIVDGKIIVQGEVPTVEELKNLFLRRRNLYK